LRRKILNKENDITERDQGRELAISGVFSIAGRGPWKRGGTNKIYENPFFGRMPALASKLA